MSGYPIDFSRGAVVPRALLLAPQLYLGGATMVVDGAAVIQLAPEVPFRRGPNVLRRELVDGQPIDPLVLDECVRFASLAHNSLWPVLVQCAMGLSRSATVSYAILRACYGVTHTEAYRRVASRHGGQVWPHRVTFQSALTWAASRGLPAGP